MKQLENFEQRTNFEANMLVGEYDSMQLLSMFLVESFVWIALPGCFSAGGWWAQLVCQRDSGLYHISMAINIVQVLHSTRQPSAAGQANLNTIAALVVVSC